MLAKARLFAFTFALAFLTISVASAQELSDSAREALATELYGEGVHAYYDGKYEEAAEALDRALALKTTDPRVHYFRGLTAFAQGQIPEAREDFLKGARMELSGPPQFYPVARSLERVQGAPRMLLEETRSYARAEADRKKKAIQEARYEQLRIAEDQVLRKPLGELPQLPEVDLSKIPNLPFPAKTGAGDE